MDSFKFLNTFFSGISSGYLTTQPRKGFFKDILIFEIIFHYKYFK